MTNDPRLSEARRWLAEDLKLPVNSLARASEDASFRRYFRAALPDGATRILMDAPPGLEDVEEFLRVTALLESCGVHVPHVHATDTGRGFVLLEDFGGTHMLTGLNAGLDPARLYSEALATLARLQLQGAAASQQLPAYDQAVLQREMQLMPEWFCARHLEMSLTARQRQVLEEAFGFLEREALSQPLVFVHRDYHSRNLMLLPERSPGVIDYQDALRGPVGYDLASILKDCYVAWPRARVEEWVDEFRALLVAGGEQGRHLAGSSRGEFLRWFDLIGLQRHIKVLGIFARLYWRDGKPGYLADLPRTLAYVQEAAGRYGPLAPLARFVSEELAPRLPEANARARMPP